MPLLNYVLLAVESPLKSAELYDRILEAKPVESAETFVLYVLPSGLKVGLWLAEEMQPVPGPAGGSELSFTIADRPALLRLYEEWKALGLKVEQKPTDMDFGFTFVVSDPDGHRLRPFVRADNPR